MAQPPALCRRLLFNALFSAFFFCFATAPVSAQLRLYRFSSSTSSDWFEVYNSGEAPLELADYSAEDAAANSLSFPACLLPAQGIYRLSWSNKLNKAGDQILLLKEGETVDCVAYGNASACDGKSKVDLAAPQEGEYGFQAAVGEWQLVSSAEPSPATCLTPTPTSSPTPTFTPTPAAAVYRILAVTDQNGDELTAVKIYVDDRYIHHYAPEELTFCPDCFCYEQVSCQLGQHTIKLEKTGYQPWQQTVTLNPGDLYEVSPQLTVLNSATPTPTATPLPTPTPIPSLSPLFSPSPSVTPSAFLKVLGLHFPSPAPSSPAPATPSSFSSSPSYLFPLLLIIIGLLLTLAAGWPFLPQLWQQLLNLLKPL